MREMRRTTMAAVLLVALVAPLAGCATATRRAAYDKPGVTRAERERDENACVRAAIGSDGSGRLLAPYCIDREVFTTCMEGRGYTVRPE